MTHPKCLHFPIYAAMLVSSWLINQDNTNILIRIQLIQIEFNTTSSRKNQLVFGQSTTQVSNKSIH